MLTTCPLFSLGRNYHEQVSSGIVLNNWTKMGAFKNFKIRWFLFKYLRDMLRKCNFLYLKIIK